MNTLLKIFKGLDSVEVIEYLHIDMVWYEVIGQIDGRTIEKAFLGRNTAIEYAKAITN